MKSVLYTKDVVGNAFARPNAAQVYYPVAVVEDDQQYPILLTADQIDVARTRARNNEEDVPRDWPFAGRPPQGFWARVKFVLSGRWPE